jgi:hypothetical protein
VGGVGCGSAVDVGGGEGATVGVVAAGEVMVGDGVRVATGVFVITTGVYVILLGVGSAMVPESVQALSSPITAMNPANQKGNHLCFIIFHPFNLQTTIGY